MISLRSYIAYTQFCRLEAVVEELLPYKVYKSYTSTNIKQLLHLVFMFTAASNLIMDEPD